MIKIEYIDGKEQNGILYDWRAIEKEYRRLGVPSEYHRPPFLQIPFNKYFIDMSDRSTGKTTTWLLLGLVMHRLYGTVIQYIRPTEDELSPSHATKLVDVLCTYDGGRYIRYLTDGKYNSIYYHWKQFFYCLIDDDGKRVEVSEKPIIQCLSIDRCMDYKSSYNAPRGDLIILDEFLARGRYYRANECVDFLDLLKTIIRERQSAIIAMLANTISLTSPYFEDFEISKEIKTLNKRGDTKQIITERGTHIFVEILDAGVTKSKARQVVNSLYYGFKNPKLSAITGEGGLYAFESVPHIPKHDDSFILVENRIYISTGTELLRCDYCYNKTLGYHMEIHRATRFYDDSVILTLDAIRDNRFVYGFGTAHLKATWNRLLIEHRVYYESNEVGAIFKDYLQKYKETK